MNSQSQIDSRSNLSHSDRIKIETYNYLIKIFHIALGFLPPFVRVHIWRLALANLGSNPLIGEGTYIQYPWKVHIGDEVQISPNLKIFPSFQHPDVFVTIGNSVLIGPNVTIYGAGHPPVNPRSSHLAKEVVIDDFAYIGGSACIRYGVTVGKHAVVAVGSVVVKDVPDYTIVGGNPAKIIGRVDPEGFSKLHD